MTTDNTQPSEPVVEENFDEALVQETFANAVRTHADASKPIEERLAAASVVIEFMSGAIAELREMITGVASSSMAGLVLAARSPSDAEDIGKLVADYMEKVERNRVMPPTTWVYTTIAARLGAT